MFSTPNLAKRGTVYYFRMAVLKALVPRFRRAELTASLRTSNPLQAKVRCRAITSAVETLFERLPRMTSISIPEINEKVRGYFQECLNKGEEHVLLFPQDPTINVLDEAAGVGHSIEQMQRDLAYACYPQDVRDMASSILDTEPGKVQNGASDEYQYACRAIMRAKIESARVLSAKLSGDYTSVAPKDILFAGMVSTGLPSLPGTKAVLVSSGLTFQEAIDRYLAQKTPAWAMKTVQFVTYALKAAAELYGPDKALAKYLATDKRLFRDTLAKLPPHQEKMAKYANLTMLQAAEANENGPFLSTKTQKKNLDFLGAFLIWATNEEYLEKPPGSGIKTAPAKTLGNVAEREPYTASDLKKIFASPIFAGSKSSTRRAVPGSFIAKDGYYWVPLIGLYTGMRLGEIIQLRSGDVEAIEGIALFKVQMDAEGSNQIKTSSSYRSIPIHAKLIELGLLKHIKDSDPAGRLFPEIKPGADGYMSHNYSKWWGRYSTKAGFARDKTAFHSFRHSFKDALDAANVPEQIAMALMGHSNNLVLSRIRAAPSARLGHLSFEGQGVFPSQC